MSSRTATTASTTTQGSVTTKPQVAPAPQQEPPTQQGQGCQMQEKIAMRAYQKWVQGGCRHGTDKQDWLAAEAEVKAEMNRPGSSSSVAQPQTRR